MRVEVFVWAAVTLLLLAGEVVVPGAFMLWLAIAAGAMFVFVLVVPGLSLLAQACAFGVLAIIAILAWRRWYRGLRATATDDPVLNRRAEALVGRVVPLERGIVNGRGRVQIADAYWDVSGPELPAGAVVRIVAAHGMTLEVREA